MGCGNNTGAGVLGVCFLGLFSKKLKKNKQPMGFLRSRLNPGTSAWRLQGGGLSEVLLPPLLPRAAPVLVTPGSNPPNNPHPWGRVLSPGCLFTFALHFKIRREEVVLPVAQHEGQEGEDERVEDADDAEDVRPAHGAGAQRVLVRLVPAHAPHLARVPAVGVNQAADHQPRGCKEGGDVTGTARAGGEVTGNSTATTTNITGKVLKPVGKA